MHRFGDVKQNAYYSKQILPRVSCYSQDLTCLQLLAGVTTKWQDTLGALLYTM